MKYFCTLIVFIFLSLCVKAQDIKIINDFHVKSGIALEYNFNKKLELSSCYQNIFKRNAKVFDEYYFELESKYKAVEFFHIAGGYRYTWNIGNYSKTWRHYNRINLDLYFNKKLKPIKLSYRLRFENSSAGSKTNFSNDSIEASFIRNRIKVTYKIPSTKIYPYLILEHYSRYSGNTDINNKVKSVAGIRIKLKTLGNIKFGYQYMRELTNNYPFNINTAFIKYTFIF